MNSNSEEALVQGPDRLDATLIRHDKGNVDFRRTLRKHLDLRRKEEGWRHAKKMCRRRWYQERTNLDSVFEHNCKDGRHHLQGVPSAVRLK